jgi:hypothetical protein
MPKETVQYPSVDGRSVSELSVHWTKEDAFAFDASGYVQLGLTRHVWIPEPPLEEGQLCSSPVRHADHSSCSACADALPLIEEQQRRKAAGEPVMSSGRVGSDAPPVGVLDPPSTAFSEPLTRTQINKLITVLRRARDQALGADA